MAEDGPVPARHAHGHPDGETLAALDADALEPAAVAQLREHVEGCGRCQDTRADLRDVRDRLAALPAPALPADVAARIDAALRTAGSDRRTAAAVADLDEQRARRTRRHRWAGLAAAGLAVIAAGGAAFAISQSGVSTSTNSSAGSANRPQVTTKAPAGGRVNTPERRTAGPGAVGGEQNYTPTSLAAAVPSLVRGGGSPGVMTDAARRAGCARALVGPGRRPLAVTHARFEGQDAYIFVFRTATAHRAEVFVVGPGCAPSDAARQFRTTAAY